MSTTRRSPGCRVTVTYCSWVRAGKLTAPLASLALLLGCGTGSPFAYVPVSGTVTYEDGSAIPKSDFQLVFESQTPPKGTAHPRPATAAVSGGKFTAATSYKYGDGLTPGKHKVTLAYATDAAGKLLMPAEYADMSRTPLVIDTADVPLTIKVPKPSSGK